MDFADFEDVKNKIVKLKYDLDVTKGENYELQDALKKTNQKADEVGFRLQHL